MAEKEIIYLKALPKDKQGPAFLKLWTQKEAFSKALGQGLTMDFKRISLSLIETEVPMDYPSLTLIDLSKAPHYFACLARF